MKVEFFFTCVLVRFLEQIYVCVSHYCHSSEAALKVGIVKNSTIVEQDLAMSGLGLKV